jgi:Protein of unknown function (DUF3987)/Toprim-like
VGVSCPRREVSASEWSAARRRETRRSILARVVELTEGTLWSETGAAARAYLAERGFTEAALQDLAFGLYRSTAEVQATLRGDGYDDEAIRETGVVWSKFEGYVIIPWADAWGQPATLYARWPGATPPSGWTKTLALPGEGTKSSPLYFDRARRAGHRDLVLVEGVLDAALAQAHGDTRVVACAAAQLSGGQVDTLVRHRVRLVRLCLDPDDGGDRGTRACVESLDRLGITPYVVPRLPDGLDPDEFLRREGLAAWHALVDRAEHGYRHRARTLIEAHRPVETWSDLAQDAALEEAVTFAASRPPDREDALSRYFYPVIAEAVPGLDLDALRARVATEREAHPRRKGNQPHDPDYSTGPDSGRSGDSGPDPEGDEWEPPLPFRPIAVPPFPIQVFPPWLRAFLEAVATALQVPMDLAAMLALSVLSVAVARKVAVLVKPGYIEPVNVYLVIVLPPGEGKSPAFAVMTDPLVTWEVAQAADMRPIITEAETTRDLIKARLDHLKNRAAKEKNPQERARLRVEAQACATELAAIVVPVLPRLIVDDVTPERLSSLLALHEGGWRS